MKLVLLFLALFFSFPAIATVYHTPGDGSTAAMAACKDGQSSTVSCNGPYNGGTDASCAGDTKYKYIRSSDSAAFAFCQLKSTYIACTDQSYVISPATCVSCPGGGTSASLSSCPALPCTYPELMVKDAQGNCQYKTCSSGYHLDTVKTLSNFSANPTYGQCVPNPDYDCKSPKVWVSVKDTNGQAVSICVSPPDVGGCNQLCSNQRVCIVDGVGHSFSPIASCDSCDPSISYECVTPCTADEYRSPIDHLCKPLPKCSSTEILVFIDSIPECRADCKNGETWDSTLRRCVAPPTCQSPNVWNYLTHACEPLPPPSTCQAPNVLDSYGNCVPPPDSGSGTSGSGDSGSGTSGSGDSGSGTSGSGDSGSGTSGTACTAGDACNQADIKKNTGDTATNTKGLWDDLKDWFKDSSAPEISTIEDAQEQAVSAMNEGNDFFSGFLLTEASDWLPAFPSDSACYGNLTFTIPTFTGSITYDKSPCDTLADLRTLLYWFFYVSTAISVVRIIFWS